ncbi:hypothetical protein [Undibacterium flavidum]|uniref:Uncharacterized protein n=1 Tax=Undibacterium flavidum TaxID=2762297 RepID=A0ABR6Y8S2_9BURK|nr:hypothetical protein [Undibacterium flavidum]MBC3873010.1 hypothetical protein [Undibacterium flavidum]
MLKPNSIYCSEIYQKDVVDIADAKTDDQVKRAVGGAIFAGACTGASHDYFVISKVESKKTPLGNFYDCFVISSLSDTERFCSPFDRVTSVKQEKAQRTGDFEIVIQSQAGVKAKCIEGGLIMISKSNQWKRIPMIFPIDLMSDEVNISKDLNYELRNGCRGVDYTD